MKKLCINTAGNKEISISLKSIDKVYQLKYELSTHRAQMVLPLIIQLLKEHDTSLHEIDSIEVNPGPGSYTGVRVGVSVANALSYALDIPVNGNAFKKDETLVEPEYS